MIEVEKIKNINPISALRRLDNACFNKLHLNVHRVLTDKSLLSNKSFQRVEMESAMVLA